LCPSHFTFSTPAHLSCNLDGISLSFIFHSQSTSGRLPSCNLDC
jgi:hypothetical protein